MSLAAQKRQFKADPTINPETGRTITVGGAKYNELVKKYGKTQKKRSQKTLRASRSPKTMARSSPGRRSPGRRSPLRTAALEGARRTRSPMRLAKDPFEVLSDESIMKVLPKLSPENQLLWANASPKVNAIYQRMTL